MKNKFCKKCGKPLVKVEEKWKCLHCNYKKESIKDNEKENLIIT